MKRITDDKNSAPIATTAEGMVSRKPGVRGGDPTMTGSRISVTDVVRCSRMHAGDLGFLKVENLEPPPLHLLRENPWKAAILKKLREDWPHIKKEQILGAWEYYGSHYEEILGLLAKEDAAWDLLKARVPKAPE